MSDSLSETAGQAESVSGSGSTDLLETLGRERAVADLIYTYCELVDALRLDEAVGLFTEDGVYDHGHGRVYQGHAALARLFDELTGNSATSHHVSNLRFEHLPSGLIACRSYVYVYSRRLSGEEVHIWGRYDDLVTAQGDTWRFVRRALLGAAEKGVRPDEGWSTRYALPYRAGRLER